MVFYQRHLCRVDPWPDWLVECFSILEANPEVYRSMNGPSEFHVIGTIRTGTSPTASARSRRRRSSSPAATTR